MAYANDTKPSGSYTNGTKPAAGVGYTIDIGTPIGLLLALTYGAQIVGDGFIAGTKPSAGSFTNDIKP